MSSGVSWPRLAGTIDGAADPPIDGATAAAMSAISALENGFHSSNAFVGRASVVPACRSLT